MSGWLSRGWRWARSHKLLTATGATVAAGAAAYVFKDALSGALKPVSDRLLQFALRQEMQRMKSDAKGAARQARFRQAGDAARLAAFVFLPQIGKQLRRLLDKKAVVKQLRECNGETAVGAVGAAGAAEAAPAEEAARALKKRKIALWGELVEIQVAQYAAAIYASSLLIASFRLHLTVLTRHKIDRQPAKNTAKGTEGASSSSSSSSSSPGGGEGKTGDPLAQFILGLEDLGSRDTRETVHTHAYHTVEASLAAIAGACRQSAEDVLGDAKWLGTTFVTGDELTSLVDKVLGGAHELLFSTALRSKGFFHDFAACTYDLEDPNCAAAAVIRETNSMLHSSAFVDVLASVASGVAKAYGDFLGDTIEAHLPRDGACAVDKAQVEVVIAGLSCVEIQVIDAEAVEGAGEGQGQGQGQGGQGHVGEEKAAGGGGGESGSTTGAAGEKTVETSKSQRERLADLLSANDGELIVRLAGIGPEMLQRKMTKTFIDDCVNVIRESGDGADHEDVDVEELVCVLENILDDMLTRLPLVKALSHGTKVTQTTMLKRPSVASKSASNGGAVEDGEVSGATAADADASPPTPTPAPVGPVHPLDDVLMKEPNLGSFLVACFEDLVDRMDAKKSTGQDEDEDGEGGDMAGMEALMKMMAGGGEGGDTAPDITALLGEAAKMDGGAADAAKGSPALLSSAASSSAQGLPAPNPGDMEAMMKMLSGGAGGMPGMPGMPGGAEGEAEMAQQLNAAMQMLGSDPGMQKEMEAMMSDPNAMAEAQKEIEALMGGLAGGGGGGGGGDAEMMQLMQAMMSGMPPPGK